MSKEMVNHPSYYNVSGKKECIDEIIEILGEAGAIFFCLGNVHKYLYRKNEKGKPDEDILKAKWYIEKAEELYFKHYDKLDTRSRKKIAECLQTVNINNFERRD